MRDIEDIKYQVASDRLASKVLKVNIGEGARSEERNNETRLILTRSIKRTDEKRSMEWFT